MSSQEINFTDIIPAFSKALSDRLAAHGPEVAEKMYGESSLIFEWLGYLSSSEITGHSDEFLEGLRASIVETIGLSAAGLARPALFSMRTQIDIIFSWLYFKDHPIEWSRVADTGKGFMLKSAIVDYLTEYKPRFKKRFEILLSRKTRIYDDPYKFLSAHVHAQGVSGLPIHTSLITIVQPYSLIQELVVLQKDVAEYLADILTSCFGHKWASLPDAVVRNVRSRVKKSEIAEVFC